MAARVHTLASRLLRGFRFGHPVIIVSSKPINHPASIASEHRDVCRFKPKAAVLRRLDPEARSQFIFVLVDLVASKNRRVALIRQSMPGLLVQPFAPSRERRYFVECRGGCSAEFAGASFTSAAASYSVGWALVRAASNCSACPRSSSLYFGLL